VKRGERLLSLELIGGFFLGLLSAFIVFFFKDWWDNRKTIRKMQRLLNAEVVFIKRELSGLLNSVRTAKRILEEGTPVTEVPTLELDKSFFNVGSQEVYLLDWNVLIPLRTLNSQLKWLMKAFSWANRDLRGKEPESALRHVDSIILGIEKALEFCDIIVERLPKSSRLS
jgi:hypothetical protein